MPEPEKITIEVLPGAIVYEPTGEFRTVADTEFFRGKEGDMCNGPFSNGRPIYTRRVIEAPKPIPVPSSWVFDEGTRLVKVTMRIDGSLLGWSCVDSKASGFNITEASFRADVEQHGGYMVWPREEKP